MVTQSDADEQLLIYIPFREVRPRPRRGRERLPCPRLAGAAS